MVLKFQALLTEANVQPEFVTHVGDNIHADVAGATNTGMRALHLKPGMILSDIYGELVT